jgi:diaminopimelate decarboxylase
MGNLDRRYPLLRNEIAGVPISELAEQFGTPTYIYDADRIRKQIAALSDFDVVRYAQKANSNLAILDLCRRAGVQLDATSSGEIHRALHAGYEPTGEPAPIIYTADIFDRDSLDLVVEKGIAVNCGSADMIDQYGERVGGGEITLRINPGFGHGHSQKTNTGGEQSKHGIWHEELAHCVERASQEHDLTVTGIHVHIGSGVDMDHLAQVAGATAAFARIAGPAVKRISAGGGLSTPYREDDPEIDVTAYYEIWDTERRGLEEQFGHPVELEIEPGRFLVAESGYLLCEIRAIKQMGKNTFYLVDAGFNNLARPILYGAYHPISIAPADGSTNERGLQDVVVGGPLCESGDIFTQEEGGFVRPQQLPVAAVGDYLVIECAGAYGFVMSSNYNSKPFTAEVLVSGGKTQCVRERQSLDDLIRGESISEF